jgi:hypothetical protein
VPDDACRAHGTLYWVELVDKNLNAVYLRASMMRCLPTRPEHIHAELILS